MLRVSVIILIVALRIHSKLLIDEVSELFILEQWEPVFYYLIILVVNLGIQLKIIVIRCLLYLLYFFEASRYFSRCLTYQLIAGGGHYVSIRLLPLFRHHLSGSSRHICWGVPIDQVFEVPCVEISDWVINFNKFLLFFHSLVIVEVGKASAYKQVS